MGPWRIAPRRLTICTSTGAAGGTRERRGKGKLWHLLSARTKLPHPFKGLRRGFQSGGRASEIRGFGGRKKAEKKTRKGIEEVDSSRKRGTDANMQFTERKQGGGSNSGVRERERVCVCVCVWVVEVEGF